MQPFAVYEVPSSTKFQAALEVLENCMFTSPSESLGNFRHGHLGMNPKCFAPRSRAWNI